MFRLSAILSIRLFSMCILLTDNLKVTLMDINYFDNLLHSWLRILMESYNYQISINCINQDSSAMSASKSSRRKETLIAISEQSIIRSKSFNVTDASELFHRKPALKSIWIVQKNGVHAILVGLVMLAENNEQLWHLETAL